MALRITLIALLLLAVPLFAQDSSDRTSDAGNETAATANTTAFAATDAPSSNSEAIRLGRTREILRRLLDKASDPARRKELDEQERTLITEVARLLAKYGKALPGVSVKEKTVEISPAAGNPEKRYGLRYPASAKQRNQPPVAAPQHLREKDSPDLGAAAPYSVLQKPLMQRAAIDPPAAAVAAVVPAKVVASPASSPSKFTPRSALPAVSVNRRIARRLCRCCQCHVRHGLSTAVAHR